MNIVVTACQVPFIHGGAIHQVNGLVRALSNAGHQVELIRFPFQFHPPGSIESGMNYCEQLDFEHPNGQRVDRVISLQFPGYGVKHPHHVVWVMHQLRGVYELYDPDTASAELRQLKEMVTAYDNRVLRRARHVFSESKRVAERLERFNDIPSEPLSHPPALEEHFRCAEPEAYIYCPSRLESLKRQDLLIEAARLLRSPVGVVFSGTGGNADAYRKLIAKYELEGRVRMLGHVSEREKLAFYAHSLAVFFGPFDEDYGYITLEAMLSSKPVITCEDSGGPLEFVVPGETGLVIPPEPEALAEEIDKLYENKKKAAEMGKAGRRHYDRLEINWSSTIDRLLEV